MSSHFTRQGLLPLLSLGLTVALGGCSAEPAPGDDDDSTPDAPLPLSGTSLLQSPGQIVGIDDELSLLGQSLTTCDFDDDGADDLVVASPESAGGRGLVSIFLGQGSADWNAAMPATSADIAFDGTVGSRVGYGVACDDFDGDGRTDIATGKARWFSPQGDELYAVAIWHASDEPWQDVHGIDEAAFITSDLNLPTVGFGGKSWMEMAAGDLDGDGAAEIVLVDRQANPPNSPVTDALYVLPGQAWSGTTSLDEAFRARLTGYSAGSFQGGALLITDLDNQPGEELLVGEPFAGPPNNHLGRVSLLRDPQGEGSLADQAYAVISESGEARAFGEAATAGDFDGDGAIDLAVTGVEENALGPEPHGSVWLYLDAASLPAESAVNEGQGHVAGDPDAGYLGMDIGTFPDRDGDGIDDLLVYQADLLDIPGTLWLLSGAQVRGDVYPEDVEITRWRSPSRGSVSDRLTLGDFDGDDVLDFALGTPQYEERDDVPMLDIGRVSIWLSGSEPVDAPESTDQVYAGLWVRLAGGEAVQWSSLNITGPRGSIVSNSSEAVIEVDRGSDWTLRFQSDLIYPTAFYGRAGQFDSFQEVTLWSPSYWTDLIQTLGVSPDPSKGHVIVGLFKRDGAGAIGRNANLSAPYSQRAVFAGEGLLADSPITPGPANRSVVYFVNVDPGSTDIQFELEEGESCYPAPGGTEPSENVPVEVAAGEITIASYLCNLNRL